MNKIIAAVSDMASLNVAVKSQVNTIFYLAPNINNLGEIIKLVHSERKKIYIHMDMAEGIGKDKFGIKFVKDLGVDGVISTRANIIKFAKAVGLSTVQRFFVIDAHSILTTIETAKSTNPDMIEIMPGVVPKIVEKLKATFPVPIICGGLIESTQEVKAMISAGASEVSTSKKELWG